MPISLSSSLKIYSTLLFFFLPISVLLLNAAGAVIAPLILGQLMSRLGATSLFGFTLKTCNRVAVGAMLDKMQIFRMGASWGGFESLLIPAYPAPLRTATRWREDEFLLRIHVGLEHREDLIADLEQGLDRLNSADL